MTKTEILQEFTKSFLEPTYYAGKYCEVFDLTQGGMYPLVVFPKQKALLEHYRANRFSLVLKPRQAGVSTVTAFHCAHLIMFATKKAKQKILIIANKQETAHEFLSKVVGFIDSAPEWLCEHEIDPKTKKSNGKVKYTKKNNGEILLPNGSGAKAKATSKDALRGYTPTLLVMDEAAFIENGEALWTAAFPSLSTGGGAILLSTPNGYDALYYALYQGAIIGKNEFKVFEMNWFQDPRFNKDLKWVKGVDEKICRRNLTNTNWNFSDFEKYKRAGYKPTSSWFESMCSQFNNDARKIAQELECDFLGSGDNVVNEEYIKQQELNTCNPISSGAFDNNLWTFEEPIVGDQYLMGVDVSRGDSADYSTLVVWDMTTGEQAAEWQGKVPPDVLGEMAVELGLKYQALAVVDITGGMGQATTIKMMDLKYPHMYYSSSKDATVIKQQLFKYKKQNDMIPGFIIGKNRVLAIQALELAIRTGQIRIKSKRIINELRTFVYKNGRADHMTGYHDDLLMAMAMLLFVFQHSFKNMVKYKAQTIAIIEAWSVVKDTRPSLHNSVVDPNIASEFDWLFK